MSASDIEWTNATWNPVAGCSILSPGCTNCYAMRMAGRLESMRVKKYKGTTRRSGGRAKWTGKIVLHHEGLNDPLKWKKKKRIFVNSMSDLFHDEVPDEFISKVWGTMGKAYWHTFQILTKRPERMRDLVTSGFLPKLPNVWLGTSVESAEYTNRIDELRETPATVRFVSFEPLLGSVKGVNLEDIHWAIVGGESGPGSRPIEKVWVEEIQRSCRRHEAAFFFKQWGGKNKKATGRKLQGKTWDEYPVLEAQG